MRRKKFVSWQMIALITFTLIFLNSCVDTLGPTWSNGDYYVEDFMGTGSNDLVLKTHQGTYRVRVKEVESLGCNERYIIIKDSSNQYWILDKQHDNEYLNREEIMMGPMSKISFDKKKMELGIQVLEFSDYF